MAVYRSGHTYFTWADVNQNAVVAYYDHATGITSNAVTIGFLGDGDAHLNPSMLIDDDGYIYVFYGSHGDNTKGKRSAHPLDIVSPWVAIADISGLTTHEAERLYRNIRDNGPDIVRERVRDQPIASTVLAFLIGAVLTGILRR